MSLFDSDRFICYSLPIMKKIKVKLEDRSYDIIIGRGVLGGLTAAIKKLKTSAPIVVVTDTTVSKKAGGALKSALKPLPNELIQVIVPDGEQSKSIEVYQDSINKISARTKGHCPVVVALGGGVVGDLAGFIASTYRRGVPFFQVPTTLLAQVDSSVGGKVGIDLPEAKNLIGSFYQPKGVFVDTNFLKTLPERQIRNGLAEVIKYGVIKKPELFSYIEKNIGDILNLAPAKLEKIIHECLKIKVDAVEKDERDCKDVRIILNFGHTLGHAIETASGYSNLYNHGESIAIGMILASEIAVNLDMLKESDLARIKNLISAAGLPVQVKGLPIKDILSSHRYDKKFVAGANRFVLPKKVGRVEVIEDIPSLLIRTVVKKYVS